MRPAEPILHVDMDAFYASVEVRRDPSLRGKPVLVGGTGTRGVVAAASYEARAFGVGSAMPMGRARRLCPHAVVLPPDFAAYQAVSAQLMALFLDVTPLVEPLSLDEAFLDVGGSVRLFGPPETIGATIRERIRHQLDLPASVGVAANKFLAKLCSGKAKPDGLLHLRAGDAVAFLATLAVGDLWGVGRQTAAKLAAVGIRTVSELKGTPGPILVRLVGTATAAQLHRLARGEDDRAVTPHVAAKSMGASETFDRDVSDPAVLRTELLRLAERVAPRLRRAAVAARTITLTVRHADFRTVTRSQTVAPPMTDATDLHRTVVALLEALQLDGAPVRLLGVAAANLVPAEVAGQLGLFGDDRWAQLERAADEARERFGATAISRAAMLDHPRTPARTGDAAPSADQWRTPG